jgi:chaperone required for assembly of F1-ATPase
MNRIAKFYKTVAVGEDGGAYVVRLDDRPVKTPARALLTLPTRALAEAVAGEWRAQEDVLDPATMPLTRLAYAAIDTAPHHRARIADEILAYGGSDLLCYRAEGPQALVARQAVAWNPLLDWAVERYGARLAVGTGIAFIEQSVESRNAFAAAVGTCDDFTLVALHGAASLTGSIVLALALMDGRLSAGEASALARLDETFQNEVWGRDAEAEARAARLGQELAAIERFLRLAHP